MGKTEILEELPKLTKPERQEIRLKLAELDGEDWLDFDDPLTNEEKALLEARLAAYAKNPDADFPIEFSYCSFRCDSGVRTPPRRST